MLVNIITLNSINRYWGRGGGGRGIVRICIVQCTYVANGADPRIQIGSIFGNFVDLGPYSIPNMDPDQNTQLKIG